jgi:CSLREA domain-containing protein
VRLPNRIRWLLAAAAVVIVFLALRPQPVRALALTVNDLGDAAAPSCTVGPTCTLRAAILDANASPEPDTITIGLSGTININSLLPTLTGGDITISVAVGETVTLNNQPVTPLAHGLRIESDNNQIYGLEISGFNDGIVISGEAGVNTASNNIIGAGAAGQRNTINRSARHGIVITGADATNNSIIGNSIGTNPPGTTAAANGGAGIMLQNGTTNNIIGGGGGQRNVISGNGAAGVIIDASDDNSVLGNIIGLNAAAANGT